MKKYFWLITAFVIIGWECHPLCAPVHSQEEAVGVKNLSPSERERIDGLFSKWDSADSPGAEEMYCNFSRFMLFNKTSRSD